jgi:hypothetical protein
MMKPMSKHGRVTIGVTIGDDASRASPGSGAAVAGLATVARSAAASAFAAFALAACGGSAKPADAPGACPEGTVLTGDACLPDPASAPKTGDSDSPKGNTGTSSTSSIGQSKGADTDTGAASYDKDAVDAQLKRAAKQIKDNCGSASDEDGNKGGPWGSTTATVVLGRNGHVHEVTVPSPYSGKPVGDCVVNSFKKIQFPPYGGSTDATVSWDIQIVEPKHK